MAMTARATFKLTAQIRGWDETKQLEIALNYIQSLPLEYQVEFADKIVQSALIEVEGQKENLKGLLK